MRYIKKKEHSVSCCNRLQSACFPDARHLCSYLNYATSEETNSTSIGNSTNQKERHNYVKNEQKPYRLQAMSLS